MEARRASPDLLFFLHGMLGLNARMQVEAVVTDTVEAGWNPDVLLFELS